MREWDQYYAAGEGSDCTSSYTLVLDERECPTPRRIWDKVADEWVEE